MTPAEAKLWTAVRGRKLNGLGFRRQHPLVPFVVDFACPSRLLIVEIDGDIHARQQQQDAARTEILSQFGWDVIRFSNHDVLNDFSNVLDRIKQRAFERQLAPGQSKST
jgi:very-short-patch-repair endonuclease